MEEWVKSYKTDSLASGGGEGGNDSDEEDGNSEVIGEADRSPYDILKFKEMMTEIVKVMLNEKQSDICIAIFSILNNLDGF